MYEKLGIKNNVVELVNACEKDCFEEFQKVDELSSYNSLKVLSAFQKYNLFAFVNILLQFTKRAKNSSN